MRTDSGPARGPDANQSPGRGLCKTPFGRPEQARAVPNPAPDSSRRQPCASTPAFTDLLQRQRLQGLPGETQETTPH